MVSPEGPIGEKVCSACGLVFTKNPVAKDQSFQQWSPDWYSNWSQKDSETLKEWLTTLRVVSCQLNLPAFPYREEAARRIRKENHALFQSQKFGKNKRATVAALLHQILREYNKNRSLKEICTELGLDSKLVKKQTWNLSKKLSTNQKKRKTLPRKLPMDYLFEFGGKITTDKSVLMEAEHIITAIRRLGGNPVTLASGALYHVFKKRKIKVSKERIAEAFKISHRTVYSNEARIRKLLSQNTPARTNKPEAPEIKPVVIRTS